MSGDRSRNNDDTPRGDAMHSDNGSNEADLHDEGVEDHELMKKIAAPPEYPQATREQVEATWQAIRREVEARAEGQAAANIPSGSQDARWIRGWLDWLFPTAPVWSMQLVKVAAFVAIGFVAAWYATGRGWLPGSTPQVVVVPDSPDAGAIDRNLTSRSLLAGNDYGGRLEALLVGLTRGEEAEPGVSPVVREVSRELLSDSRFYRRVADRSGDPALSDLLSRVEIILLALATVPEGQGEKLVEELRGYIGESDFLSEIREVRSTAPPMPRPRRATVGS